MAREAINSRHLVFLYVVSNRHVVLNNPFIRVNTKVGGADIGEILPHHWLYREDQDIAVCPLKFSDAHKVHYFPLGSMLTKEAMIRENIGPGDEVFAVGRFINHEGRQCNTPCVRFGNLAMMPHEPVWHPTNTTQQQESFLVDIRTMSGYSGSPVFVCIPIFRANDGGFEILGKPMGPWLLGVEWGGITDGHRNHTGMYGVVPAWILIDLLNDPRLVAIRQADDDKSAAEIAKQPTELT